MAVFHTEYAFVDREAPTRVAPVPEVPRSSRSGIRARDPEREANEIATRVIERFEVAKSLARILAGAAKEQAAVAGAGLRALAEQTASEIAQGESAGRIQRFAKAAAAAAVHAATAAAERRRAPREPGETLDPETLRDDAC
jgi:hypothetical protein